MNRFFFIIISILFLSSCSGTGKNNLILSQELKSNDTQVFVKRETGFPGIAALIRVLLNGKEIGELGENERLSANTTEGEGSIAAHFTMIASIGANEGVTKLSGASFVYLCAEATLVDGTVISVCDKTDKTALNFVGDDIWEVTIWPKDIFELNFSDQITMITYNFQDKNGNNIVRDFSTGEDFTMFASCQ